jgi:trk system potassium uptake protein TrkH
MRESRHLRQRYRLILAHTGSILALAGGLMLVPLLAMAAWKQDGARMQAYLLPGTLMAAGGLLLRRLMPRAVLSPLNLQEGGVIVFLSWLGVCLGSALPFMLESHLNFTQAVFESVSGWTTTGLSVVDVTKASHALLLWRSTMQLAGGAGLAILMLAALTGPAGTALHSAEGRDQLVPNVRQSAKLVLTIYTGYVIAGIAAYVLAGMPVFDAINHTFAAISTGGFSTQPESIGHWDSVAIEAVTLPLMLLGSLNFVTAWLLLRGKMRAVLKNGEVRLVAVLLPLTAGILFLLTCRGLYPSLPKAIRVAVFESVTALTTTGFSTVSYNNWNGIGIYVLIALMLIGGGICSTAGGIKQFRIYLLAKALWWQVRMGLLPPTAVVARTIQDGERERQVSDSEMLRAGLFVFLYLVTIIGGTGIMVAYGFGLQDALLEYASTLGTVGLSIGVTSPNLPAPILWAQIAGMLLGRLEFFVLFTAILKLRREIVDSVTLLRRNMFWKTS